MASNFPATRVIVVGGGLAGFSAANTVLEHGGRVILLDKSAFCGYVYERLHDEILHLVVIPPKLHPVLMALRPRLSPLRVSKILMRSSLRTSFAEVLRSPIWQRFSAPTQVLPWTG